MKKEKLYAALVFIVVFIIWPVFATSAVMTSSNYQFFESVLSGGGSTMSSANYQINSTLGQTSPLLNSDNPPTSANYQLFPGIWYTIWYTSPQTIEVGPGYAYTNIQDAINNAYYCEIILVHDGIYNENIDFQGKGVIICSENGPNSTIINGDGAGPVVTFNQSEGSDSLLMGFSIKSGYAVNGGGILCQNSAPIIANCLIIDNGASSNGGGIYGYNSAPMIINSLLQSNTKNGAYNQICLEDDSTTYNDTQIVSFTDDNRVFIQTYNHAKGKWQSGYRFFGSLCGLNIPLQDNDILFISFLP